MPGQPSKWGSREECRGSISSSTALSNSWAMRTLTTSGLGTRAFLGWTRSSHGQSSCLPPITLMWVASGSTWTSGSVAAMARMSSRVAMPRP